MVAVKNSKSDELKQSLEVGAGSLLFSEAGVGRVQLPGYTTTERDALTALDREVIYNTTTNKLNLWNGSAWEAVTSS